MSTVRTTVLTAVFALLIMTVGVSAQAAGSSTQMAAAPQTTTAPAADSSRNVLYVDRFVAIAAGGVLSALAADLLLDAGGPYTIVLGTMGLVVGDWWYKEGMWPFHKPNQMPIDMNDPTSPFKDLLSQNEAPASRIW